MNKNNLIYIQQVIDIIDETNEFIKDFDSIKFIEDAKTNKAVAHNIQIIGEASNQISKDFRKQHPNIPWRKIIGLRHKIVHDYLEIDLDILWDITQKDLPVLKDQFSSILQS